MKESIATASTDTFTNVTPRLAEHAFTAKDYLVRGATNSSVEACEEDNHY